MDVQTSAECAMGFANGNQRKTQLLNPSARNSEPMNVLISVEQLDGTSQIVQVTKEQAEALGISFVNETVNAQNVQPEKEQEMLVAIGKNTVVEVYGNADDDKNLTKPLGSCENPIEIIKDGEVLHSTQNLSRDYLQQIAQALKFESAKAETESTETVNTAQPRIIYRVVYPEELNLKPIPTKSIKRGRPKKKPQEEKPNVQAANEPRPTKSARTRSGRITRPPQYIKKDFKKIDTSVIDSMETELKTVEFEPLKTNQPPTPTDAPAKTNQLENHSRKRLISSQYRCPKCNKAYLGHSKMFKHFQMHPDHGPIPERCKARHNDTWNYLIDLSNKSPAGQRGLKFCKELASFIYNLRILAKIFFKQPTSDDKNLYFVDDTLSSLLGIKSGNYVLNESDLNKEVYMFSRLHETSDSKKVEENEKVSTNTNSFDLDILMEKCPEDPQNLPHQEAHSYALNGSRNDNFNAASAEEKPKSNCSLPSINFDTIQNSSEYINCDIVPVKNFNTDGFHEEAKRLQNNPDLSLHGDLLSESSLLNSLPNLRTSVDELMLNNVDSTQVSNLLDNSTSSDEVMNVDQFVNERIKNLTESDLELPNTSLNLDLPSLELFQFHTS